MDRLCTECIHKYLCSTEKPCSDCFNNVAKPHWEPYNINAIETPTTDDKNISMIKSIIDEAMDKKDRSVSIFIRDGATSITVTPLGADEPRWIKRVISWECSVCGGHVEYRTRYCPKCGEALKAVDEEKNDDDH